MKTARKQKNGDIINIAFPAGIIGIIQIILGCIDFNKNGFDTANNLFMLPLSAIIIGIIFILVSILLFLKK